MENTNDHPIIIFDGVCNFCNASVNFILKYDKKGVFRFAANQSEVGQQLLKQHDKDTEDVGALYMFDQGKMLSHSTAALTITQIPSFPLENFERIVDYPPIYPRCRL